MIHLEKSLRALRSTAIWQLFEHKKTGAVRVQIKIKVSDLRVTPTHLVCTLPPDLVVAIAEAYDECEIDFQAKPPDVQLPDFGPLPDMDEDGTAR